MDLLDVGFVLAATAFFKQQFALKGKAALGAAFAVALFVGFAPVVSDALPALGAYLDAAVKVISLFILGAGSYDLLSDVSRKLQG